MAGTGSAGFAEGDALTTAQFSSPSGVALSPNDSNVLFCADFQNHRIRRISLTTGVVTTVAGTGAAGFADGPGTSAQFNSPFGLAVDISNTIYVVDLFNHRIRPLAPDGTTTSVAGSTQGFTDAAGAAAQFNNPRHLAIAADASLYIADSTNHRIRHILNVKAAPTLSLNAITKTFTDPDFAPGATSNSSSTPTYTSSNTAVATITGGQLVHIVGGGTTTITANFAADVDFLAGTVSATLTVNKINPTVTFNSISKTFGDADFAPGATSNSSGAITYTSSNTSVATVVAGQIHIVGTGTTTITANVAADASYFAATKDATLSVSSATPTIASNISATPNPASVGESVSFSFTASASPGATLTYAWTFGDGTTDSGTSVTHMYSTEGVFTVGVTATDNFGKSVTAIIQMTVQANETESLQLIGQKRTKTVRTTNGGKLVFKFKLEVNASTLVEGASLACRTDTASATFALPARGRGLATLTSGTADSRLRVNNFRGKVAERQLRGVLRLYADTPFDEAPSVYIDFDGKTYVSE